LLQVDFGESPSDWLDYRETGSLLRGVPLEQDAVSHHNFALNILRRGKILLATRCTIQVLRENEMGIGNQEADSNVQPGLQSAWLHCLPAEPVVTMVVSVGTSLRDITAHRRVQLIRDLCLFVDDAKVVNSQSASLEVDKPEGRAVFLSGDGNAPFGLNGTGVSIAWPLACGGDTSQLPTLDQVELTAGDGSMSQAIGFDVLGWRVENRRQAGLSRTAKSLNRSVINVWLRWLVIRSYDIYSLQLWEMQSVFFLNKRHVACKLWFIATFAAQLTRSEFYHQTNSSGWQYLWNDKRRVYWQIANALVVFRRFEVCKKLFSLTSYEAQPVSGRVTFTNEQVGQYRWQAKLKSRF